MSTTEIVLIIAGVIVMFMGYVMPAKKKEMDDDLQLIGENEVRKLIDKELEGAKEHISDIVDETVTYAMEKTERSMERLANEKIMAINEYSDTVLEEINKNHKEVLFLYDMLNDKHENLKTTVSEAGRTAEEIKQTLKDAEITAKEAREAAIGARESAKEKEAEETETVKGRIDTIFDDGFVPIMPPRVEIIHDPDADYDYVATQPSATEFAEPKPPRRARKTSQFETEAKPAKKRSKAKRAATVFEEEEWKQLLPVDEAAYANEPQEDELAHMPDEEENENTRNSNDRILELHKAGKSNMAIAKELGLGIGEVKLVIDLFEGL